MRRSGFSAVVLTLLLCASGTRAQAPDATRSTRTAAAHCYGGDVEACWLLATRARLGEAGVLDASAARRLLDSACRAGHARSCTDLATMLLAGVGGPAVPQRAADLMIRAQSLAAVPPASEASPPTAPQLDPVSAEPSAEPGAGDDEPSRPARPRGRGLSAGATVGIVFAALGVVGAAILIGVLVAAAPRSGSWGPSFPSSGSWALTFD